MVLATLRRLADELRAVVTDLEPDRLSGADAAGLLSAFADLEKLAAGGRMLTAGRVESSNVWRSSGHRSAASHVAEIAGTGVGPAAHTLQTARRLQALPTTEEAVRHGRLSEVQVREIAGAASVVPASEDELVRSATAEPLSVLKLRCQRVKATGRGMAATYRAIHRGRYLRNWIDEDGAVRLDARLTPDAGARLLDEVRVQAERLAVGAKRAGAAEPERALAADALVHLACRSGAAREGDEDVDDAPRCMVHVRVDHASLVRGRIRPGEVCEIPGVGPIPVEVARDMANDAILSVLVTDGVDVMAVAHAGRTIPAPVRRALVERDRTCVVPGCEVRSGLEIDHVVPFARGGPTSLANLARLCHWHHYLKTHQRHRLERRGREWVWTPPTGTGAPRLC